MSKEHLKYLTLPLLYVLSVFLAEFYPNILTSVIWLISILFCIIGLIKLLSKKLDLKWKWALVLFLLIPVFDLTLGITNKIRDGIKGQIVFNVIDDSFATTESLIVREKNNELIAERDFSVAGIGQIEKVNVKILNDSTLIFERAENDYSEILTLDRKNHILKTQKDKRQFRILTNQILE